MAQSTVIITGTTSGVGLQAARALAERPDWHVIMACRNLTKMVKATQDLKIPADKYTMMQLDLASLASVRQFVADFRSTGDRKSVV